VGPRDKLNKEELMFISKMALSRRTVLRGMGATIALPFLESMAPALTASVKTAANPQRRFGAIYVPLGERPGSWTPTMSGSGLELSPILKPLEAFKNQMVVVSDLCVPRDGHAVSVGAWLTGSLPKQTIAEDVMAGTSIDQVIAKKIGQETVFPSLEVATEDFTGYIGGCDTQFACAYMNTISWLNPTTPLPMEINPRVLFERMFGRPGTSAQRLSRMQKDRSILDSVKGDVVELEGGLGVRDRTRLSDYLENVREIEQRIQRAEKQATTELVVPDAPVGVPESFEDHTMLLYDLLALAYEADITRVFSFMLNREASVSWPRHHRTAPCHVASRSRPGKDGESGQAQHVSRRSVQAVRGEAAIDARWRRLAARSFVHSLRQQHERERYPFPVGRANSGGGRGCGVDQRKPSRERAEGNAARELHAGHCQQVRRRDDELRNAEHWQVGNLVQRRGRRGRGARGESFQKVSLRPLRPLRPSALCV
jgi:Protein of unknown function (DUF1552)